MIYAKNCLYNKLIKCNCIEPYAHPTNTTTAYYPFLCLYSYDNSYTTPGTIEIGNNVKRNTKYGSSIYSPSKLGEVDLTKTRKNTQGLSLVKQSELLQDYIEGEHWQYSYEYRDFRQYQLKEIYNGIPLYDTNNSIISHKLKIISKDKLPYYFKAVCCVHIIENVSSFKCAIDVYKVNGYAESGFITRSNSISAKNYNSGYYFLETYVFNDKDDASWDGIRFEIYCNDLSKVYVSDIFLYEADDVIMTPHVYSSYTFDKGTTALRPIANKGEQYFDETLGKYICWNGTAWVNLDGTALS